MKLTLQTKNQYIIENKPKREAIVYQHDQTSTSESERQEYKDRLRHLSRW